MKKQTIALLALLFLFSWTWTSAEEISVKVAGDRTAVVHVTDTDSADPDVSGSFNGSADLKQGKSAFKADLVLKSAAELQGAKAGFYSKMTGKTIEAIGFIDAKVPSEPDAPKVLDIKAETVTEGDQSAANFSINVVAPNADQSVPTGSGSANIEGDFKAITSSGDFSFSGGDIKVDEIPFKSFSFEINEADNKTSISFEIKVAKDAEMAAQLDQIPAMAPMLEGQLKQANIQFEGLEFPAPTEQGDLKVGTGKLTIIDLRGTIRPFLGFAAGGLQAEMGPDVDVQSALESMLEVKFDKFAFNLDVGADKMDGKFQVNLSSLDKFYEGYLVILPAVQKQSNQEMARELDEFGPLFIAFMDLNSEQAVKAIRAALQSNMKLTADAKFALEPKGEDLSFTASGKLLTSDYKDYLAKAKEAGLPVAEKAVGHFDLSLKDGTTLAGQMYLFTDGDLVSYYKGMLGNAAKSSGAPQDVVDAINSLELNQVAMKMDLQDNKVSLAGLGDTSDLTAVTKMVIQKAAPQVEANLTGATFAAEMPEGNEGKVDFKIFFSDFMPGKNEAQIKESLGLPGSATVTLEASGDDTKLVAVDAPELAVDGKLAEVQSAGQKLLASSPADMGGGEGGGGKMALIAIGGLLIVGVLGFLMFGKKS
jgi:hypothetical protein